MLVSWSFEVLVCYQGRSGFKCCTSLPGFTLGHWPNWYLGRCPVTQGQVLSFHSQKLQP